MFEVVGAAADDLYVLRVVAIFALQRGSVEALGPPAMVAVNPSAVLARPCRTAGEFSHLSRLTRQSAQ